MERTIRVLIADDHAILRDGLSALINAQSDMEVVAEAENGEEAVIKCQRERPEVLVIDIKMPGGGGIKAIERVRRECSHTKVIVLSMHDDIVYLRAAIAAGCSGYLAKSTAAENLLDAIRQVGQGKTYINVSVTTSTLDQLFDMNKETCSPKTRLSSREKAVLRFVAQGYTNKQIGEKLGLAKKTVDTYRSRVSKKLGLKGRAEFVRYAVETGLLENIPGSS